MKRTPRDLSKRILITSNWCLFRNPELINIHWIRCDCSAVMVCWHSARTITASSCRTAHGVTLRVQRSTTLNVRMYTTSATGHHHHRISTPLRTSGHCFSSVWRCTPTVQHGRRVWAVTAGTGRVGSAWRGLKDIDPYVRSFQRWLRDVRTGKVWFTRVVLRHSAEGGQYLVLITLFGTLLSFQNRCPKSGTLLDFYIFFFFF